MSGAYTMQCAPCNFLPCCWNHGLKAEYSGMHTCTAFIAGDCCHSVRRTGIMCVDGMTGGYAHAMPAEVAHDCSGSIKGDAQLAISQCSYWIICLYSCLRSQAGWSRSLVPHCAGAAKVSSRRTIHGLSAIDKEVAECCIPLGDLAPTLLDIL